MSLVEATPAPAVPEVAGPDASPISARDFLVWRLCTWAGVVYMVGELVSWAIVAGFVPPPRQNWSPERVAAFYRDNEVAIRLGMEGVLIFALFYALLTFSLSRLMTHIEGRGGFLWRIQLLGGVVTALITMGCAIFWLTATFRAGSRDPSDIQLLNDLGWMVFDLTVMATVLQFVAFGIACLYDDGRRERLFPRWLGYFSFWVAFTFVAVFFMPWFFTGPLSWQGLITLYVALGAFFAWIAAVIPLALRAIGTIEREQLG